MENPLELILNAGRVLKRAWSIRFLVLAFGLAALEFILQSFGESLPIPPRA